ncbi:hypothetical protein ACFL4G_08550, partial [Thermodesulfobacteriota bacterium]
MQEYDPDNHSDVRNFMDSLIRVWRRGLLGQRSVQLLCEHLAKTDDGKKLLKNAHLELTRRIPFARDTEERHIYMSLS